MGFSCSCDFGYDGPGPGDYFFSYGIRKDASPDPGQKCCECKAPLPMVDVYETPNLKIYAEARYSGWELRETMDDETMARLGISPDDCDDPGCRPPEKDDPDEHDEVHAGGFEEGFIKAIHAATEWRWLGEDEYGWSRHSSNLMRCERCSDLALAFTGAREDGGLGYCDPGPDNLLEAHNDWTYDGAGSWIVWRQDRDGIYQPQHREREETAA